MIPRTLIHRTLLALALVVLPTALAAQMRVTLNVASHPNPYISSWRTRQETAMLTVTQPPGASATQVKFKVEVKRDGAVQARTKLEKMAVVTVPAGPSTTVYYAEQLFPYNAIDFPGNSDKTAIRSGMLPAGDYEFCVDLVNPASGASYLAGPVCRPFTLTSYQAPVLLQPEDKSAVRAAQPRPTFRWTPIVPKPPSIVRYRVMVFEVLAGQSAMTAFKSNRPVMDREVIGTTQLLWPPDFVLPGRVANYIWSVRASDEQGNPLGEPDGYADPFTFSVALDSSRGGKGLGGVGLGRDAGVGLDKGAGAGRDAGRDAGGGNAGRRQAGGEGDAGGNLRQGGHDTLVDQGGGGLEAGLGTGFAEKKSGAGGPPQYAPLDAWSDANCGLMNPPVITDTVPSGGAFAKDDSVYVGMFTMKLGDVTGGGSGLSGVGQIYVSWLWTPIAVQFQGLKLNAAKRVFSGAVTAKVDSAAPQFPQQWGINAVLNMSWSKWLVGHLDGWLKQNGKIVSLANQQVTPLALPIGVNNAGGYTLAISDMRFTKDSAVLSAVAAVPMNAENDTLGFVASRIPFSTGGVATKGRLDLLADITLGDNGNGQSFDVIIRKRTAARQGTWLQWNCNDFDTIALDFDVEFPRTWLVPSPDTVPGKKVAATFRGRMTDMDDWIVDASLARAMIVGTNGLEIEAQKITYDHSDAMNPQGIIFPKGFIGDTSLLFRGFYVKNLTMVLPDKLRTFADSTKRIAVSAENMIINKTGLTATFTAKNVLQYPKANIARLGASIDTVKVSLVNSSVTTAYMRGLITIPVSDTGQANTLNYKALFAMADTSFQFTLTPRGPITAKMFSDAKLTLDTTSSLKLKLGRAASSFNLELNGRFEWNDIDVGPIKNVKLATKFQGMKLAYSDTSAMTFAIGKWSFASPPKWIANFPVTIEDVKFAMKPKQGDEVLHGALAFEVIVNLDSNKIGGRSKLELECAVDRPAGKWYRPRIIGARVDSIAIYTKLPAVTMDGFVKFYQNDPMYGNGFKGYVKAAFNTAQIEVTATALFGNTTYNSATKYRYWYVDAKAILPPPGIPFLPGYAFYGFGAGAWRHVNVSNIPKPDPAQIASAASAMTSTASGATFTPDKNVNFGFKATAVLGTAPDPSKMNADVSLSGQFLASGGMQYINFNGDIYGMAKLTERATAPVTGNLNINYDFPTKVFHLAALVNINKDPISTPGGINAVVHVEGKTGIWYVKVGEPNARNTIRVAGVNCESYFMFGKNITPPSGFSAATTNGLHSVGVWGFSPDASATNNAIAGNGFAAGVGVNFDAGDRYKHLFGRVNLKWRAAGGFEVNLSMLRYPDAVNCSNGAGLVGLNKWYTQGSVAAWALFYCGIHIDPGDPVCAYCCKRKHENGCDYGIADLRLGAYLSGGFPKPTWLVGSAAGSFDLLGGLVKGSFNADINYGTQCTPAGAAEATPGVPAQDAAAEQGTQLIKKLYPANNTYYFGVNDRPRAVYGFVPNETFDVVENQGGNAGVTLNRTFQARYTVTYQKRDTAGVYGPPMQMRVVTNDLGERIYALAGPVAVPNQQAPLQRNVVLNPNPVPGPAHPAVQYNMNPHNQIDVEADPPSPPPLDVGPDLQPNVTYKVTVRADLYERAANGTWAIARKRNGQTVTDTRTTVFRTGGMEVRQMRNNVGNQMH